jgi:uncharacterized membrane protein YraQ (UPF0718 family)
MNWKRESKKMALILGMFALAYFMPVDGAWCDNAVGGGLRMVQDYARRHALQSLLPAILLAGAISAFLNKSAVLKYLGAGANRAVAYAVASVSGAILSVCSCGVLPLFAGIYRMGAGIGPATAFLYAGPAINVLAIVLTLRVLGPEMALARAVGAIGSSVIVGLAMAAVFRRQEAARLQAAAVPPAAGPARPLWQTGGVMGALVLVLVFLNWTPTGFRGVLRCCPDGKTSSLVEGLVVARSADTVTFRDAAGKDTTVDSHLVENLQPVSPWSTRIYLARHILAGLAGLLALVGLLAWFRRAEMREFGLSAYTFTGQILPPLLIGVLLSGVLLGREGQPGVVPPQWIVHAVGGNSPGANLTASLAGAMMYFATLTEVPIVQGLVNSGMGRGPALAMLLAGPAVSLPSLLVLAGLMGIRKTLVYVTLVVALATGCGMAFGAFFA